MLPQAFLKHLTISTLNNQGNITYICNISCSMLNKCIPFITHALLPSYTIHIIFSNPISYSPKFIIQTYLSKIFYKKNLHCMSTCNIVYFSHSYTSQWLVELQILFYIALVQHTANLDFWPYPFSQNYAKYFPTKL